MSDSKEARRHAKLEDLFHRAMSAGRDRIHATCYSFAGRLVMIRVVGDRLEEAIALAFGHLRQDVSTSPDLTIDLWDQRETGIRSPLQTPPDSPGLSPASSISEDSRFVTSVLRQSIASLDRERRHIVGVALDADRLSLYERGRPLHVPLSYWHADQGAPLTHAALVAHEGHGILLAGTARAGKTVSALACTKSGFHYLADDLTGLEIRADGTAWGHSIFGSAFLDEQTILRSPALAAVARSGMYDHEAKRLLFVSQVQSMELAPRTRIRAVVLLQNERASVPSFRRATRSESLLTLARGALRNAVFSLGRDEFALLGRLSESVPSFWLQLGGTPDQTPHHLKSILEAAKRATK